MFLRCSHSLSTSISKRLSKGSPFQVSVPHCPSNVAVMVERRISRSLSTVDCVVMPVPPFPAGLAAGQTMVSRCRGNRRRRPPILSVPKNRRDVLQAGARRVGRCLGAGGLHTAGGKRSASFIRVAQLLYPCCGVLWAWRNALTTVLVDGPTPPPIGGSFPRCSFGNVGAPLACAPACRPVPVHVRLEPAGNLHVWRCLRVTVHAAREARDKHVGRKRLARDVVRDGNDAARPVNLHDFAGFAADS